MKLSYVAILIVLLAGAWSQQPKAKIHPCMDLFRQMPQRLILSHEFQKKFLVSCRDDYQAGKFQAFSEHMKSIASQESL